MGGGVLIVVTVEHPVTISVLCWMFSDTRVCILIFTARNFKPEVPYTAATLRFRRNISNVMRH
jgi:hypothetical protein